MTDAFPYGRVYDRLRRHGYHEQEDAGSHLLPYVAWLQERTAYRSVLDIGCGGGGSLTALASRGARACGIDVSNVAVQRACASGLDAQVACATALPFEDNAFELVVSADVFEHLHKDDIEAAVNEAIRVASRFIFMRIATREDVGQPWKTMLGHPLHLTVRPIDWWQARFQAAGRFIRAEDQLFCLEVDPDA